MQEILKAGIQGVITIGIITALFLPGRQTVAGFKAASSGFQGILRTSITGK